MDYDKELRRLISNLLKRENRTSTDSYILCPICQTWMEFRGRDWHCLGKGCGFMISEKELPGPNQIDSLIKEVKSEKRVTEIKDLIREIIKTK